MAIGAFFMAQGLIFASWASRIPDVKSMLSLSDGELGTLLFTIPIGEAVSIIPTGMLVARYGSKVSAAVALAMYALSLASLPLAGSFWMLAVQLFCLGFSVNVLSVSINTQAVFLEKIYDRSIMSSFHGMWSLGGLTGGIIGAGFAHFLPQLAWHFTSILVVCLLLIAVCYHLLIPGRESADKGETVDFSIRNIDSYIWILGIITFASMFSEGITYDWSAVYFESVVHADNSLIRMGYVAALGAVTLCTSYSYGLRRVDVHRFSHGSGSSLSYSCHHWVCTHRSGHIVSMPFEQQSCRSSFIDENLYSHHHHQQHWFYWFPHCASCDRVDVGGYRSSSNHPLRLSFRTVNAHHGEKTKHEIIINNVVIFQ